MKPSVSQKTLAAVAQEGVDLPSGFAEHPQVTGMLSYRLLQGAIHDHGEVKTAGAGAPPEIAIKPAAGFLPIFAEASEPGGRPQRP